MEEGTPCIPTFFCKRPNVTLSSPEEIYAYIIAFMFANEGWTTSYDESEMLSFRVLMSNYENKPEDLSLVMTQQLSKEVKRYFPDVSAQVEAELLEDSKYIWGIRIAFVDSAGAPVSQFRNLRAMKDGTVEYL